MDDEAFIEDIKKYEELYHKKSEFYTDIRRKERIWKNLNEKYGIDAKRKWTAIRDRYVKEKKKMAIPNVPRPSSCWRLFSNLHFLDNYIKPRNNNSFKLGFEENYLMESLNPDIDENSLVSTSSQWKKIHSSKQKTMNEINDAQNFLLETLHKFNNRINQTGTSDDDENFLNSLSYVMKKMEEKEKTIYMIYILQRAEEAVINSENFHDENYLQMKKDKLKLEREKMQIEIDLKKYEIDQQAEIKKLQLEQQERLELRKLEMEIEKEERLKRYELELKYKVENFKEK